MGKYTKKQVRLNNFKYKPEYQRAMSNRAKLKINRAVTALLQPPVIPDNDYFDRFLAKNIMS
jgi:hypothetical protein